MIQEQLSRVEAIQQHIEDARYKDYDSSFEMIYEEMVKLNSWKSFTGKMMAESKRVLNAEKVKAYHNLIGSQRAIGYELPTSIAKDYIASKCGELQYHYDIAERTNNACGYAIETLRSILSAMKQEMATLNYTGNDTGGN